MLTVGSGPGLIIVGGVLQSAEDYLGLARELAPTFTVHVMNRRERADSGPYGPHYGLEREREDLAAVQRASGALRVFGHSYGGLIVLESLAHGDTPLAAASVYEPGVSINGSIPTAWIPRYRQFLADGNPYAAFAHFIGNSPQAPAIARYAPQWYLRTALRLMPGFKERIEPYLLGNALEHEVIARHGGVLADFAGISQPVQLLVGSRSPGFVRQTEVALGGVIPTSRVEVLGGLEHRAPLARHPRQLAEVIKAWLIPEPTAL